jgi:hypothetical protein
MVAGRRMKLPWGIIFIAFGSKASPMPTENCPEMTVTISSVG